MSINAMFVAHTRGIPMKESRLDLIKSMGRGNIIRRNKIKINGMMIVSATSKTKTNSLKLKNIKSRSIPTNRKTGATTVNHKTEAIRVTSQTRGNKVDRTKGSTDDLFIL